jgi:sec-independent protein translocase protein TatA
MTAIAWLFPLGFQELLLILLIVLVVFGATKIPQLGRGLGEGIRNFKKGLDPEDEGGKKDEAADKTKLPPDDARR